jgi:ABC-2 type transport system permease protein
VSALAGSGGLARPGRRAGSGPLAGSGALAKLALRRDRIMLPAWVYVLAALMVSTGYSFREFYQTAGSREALAASIARDPALLALTGPLQGTSVGALTVYKYGAFCAAAAGLMSIFLVIRHTRADEEAGRLELVGSAAVGRNAALAAGLLLGAAASGLLALLMTAGLIVIGLPAGGSAAIGLAVGGCGLVFAAVAAVAAQLSGTARGARGIAIGVLAAAYLLMSLGTAAGARGPHWLTWLSPVGWATEIRAYAGDRWPVLALPVALAGLLAAAAAALAARRDLGAGLLPPRPGPAHAAASLRSPLALAWRLQRGGLLGWAAAALLAGAAVGSVEVNIGSMLGSSTSLRTAIARLGGQAAIGNAYLAAMMGVFGLAAAAYAVSAASRLRGEESAQRAEAVLATAASRVSWGASHLLIAGAGAAAVLAISGIGAGLGYGLRTSQAGQVGPDIARLLGAALAQLPAALAVAAVAVALFGLMPRACVAGGWAALALAALIALFGPTLRLTPWLQDISPFTHAPRLPGGPVTAAPLIWLSLAAMALTAAGLAGLRRRDIG